MTSREEIESLKFFIRDIPDFPKPGILFHDLTPLFRSPEALQKAVAILETAALKYSPTVVAAAEARGFILGAPLALRMGLGFVPLRKPGKLPWETIEERYALEYGEARLQMHRDAVGPGDRVLLVDDLLATGGTAAAAARLIQRAGAEVAGILFVVELADLGGREVLREYNVERLITFAF